MPTEGIPVSLGRGGCQLEETYDVIKKRNNERNTTLKNDKIDEMLFKWEVPTNVETDTVEYKVNLEKKNKLKIK